jgi:hypothetical protein
MGQLNLHISPTPPRRKTNLPILHELTECYKAWQNLLISAPRIPRNTIGKKIDNLFTDIIEITINAAYTGQKNKINSVRLISNKFDILKYFITIFWEIKAIDTKKYANLSKQLLLIGNMLGGWLKKLEQQKDI